MSNVAIQECRTADDVRALARRIKGIPSTPVVRLEQRVIKAAPKPADRWVEIHAAFRMTDAWEGILTKSAQSNSITLKKIMHVVCAFYRIGKMDFLSGRRNANLVRARHIFSHLARKHTTHSYPAIGRILGGRDHTTILNGIHRVREMLKTVPETAAEIEEIEILLFSESLGVQEEVR